MNFFGGGLDGLKCREAGSPFPGARPLFPSLWAVTAAVRSQIPVFSSASHRVARFRCYSPSWTFVASAGVAASSSSSARIGAAMLQRLLHEMHDLPQGQPVRQVGPDGPDGPEVGPDGPEPSRRRMVRSWLPQARTMGVEAIRITSTIRQYISGASCTVLHRCRSRGCSRGRRPGLQSSSERWAPAPFCLIGGTLLSKKIKATKSERAYCRRLETQ